MKKFIILSLLFTLPLHSFAVIAFSTSTGASVNPGLTLNWSHTITGANTLLAVNCMSGTQDADMISAISFNSVALTKQRYQQRQSGATWGTSLWALLNPTTGANTISVTSTVNTAIFCSAGSYTGILQSGLPETVAGTSSATKPITVTTSSVTTGAWMIGGAGGDNTVINCANNASTTSRNVTSNQECLFDSNSELVAGSNYTVSVTVDGVVIGQSVAVFVVGAAADAVEAVAVRKRVMAIFDD